MTKSRLAFTIFNSLLIGLLLIHFAASQFYDKNSDQPPNMVFPALFATGMYFKAEMFFHKKKLSMNVKAGVNMFFFVKNAEKVQEMLINN